MVVNETSIQQRQNYVKSSLYKKSTTTMLKYLLNLKVSKVVTSNDLKRWSLYIVEIEAR